MKKSPHTSNSICPARYIRGTFRDDPVRFGSVREAVVYLEAEISRWLEEQPSVVSGEAQQAVFDKEELFRSEGMELKSSLTSLEPELNENLDRIWTGT